MTSSECVAALLAIPQPGPDSPAILIAGEQWDIPIHDAPHVRLAFAQWVYFLFPSPEARREAAERLTGKAAEFGLLDSVFPTPMPKRKAPPSS